MPSVSRKSLAAVTRVMGVRNANGIMTAGGCGEIQHVQGKLIMGVKVIIK